jgi:hypothetical protein
MYAKAQAGSRWEMSRRRFAGLPVSHESEIGRPRYPKRLKNLVQGQLDVRVEPIYSFISVATATALAYDTFFITPQGQAYTGAGAGAAVRLTAWHTTMIQPGVMDAPKKMLVKAISIIYESNTNPLDANAVSFAYLFTFNTLNKQFWQGHGHGLPAGGGVFSSGGTTAAAALSTANGWPDSHNIALITDDAPDIPGYPAPPPITGVLLETSQPFNLTADPTQVSTVAGVSGAAAVYTTQAAGATPPGTGLLIWCYFHGLTLVAVV